MSLSSIHRLWAIMAGTGDGVLKNITGKAGGHAARFCHAARVFSRERPGFEDAT